MYLINNELTIDNDYIKQSTIYLFNKRKYCLQLKNSFD